MSEVRILTVETDLHMKMFLDVPHAVHARHPLWVPNLKFQDRAMLTPGKHPFWEKAERKLFIAMRGDTPVGRIAAICDYNYNSFAEDDCGAFGFFECENDQEAANALFTATSEWHKNKNLSYMRGPLNPSTNYTCGMLVEGFDLPPCLMMPWNPSWYPCLLENFNMRKEQDLYAYLFQRDKMNLPDWLMNELKIVRERGDFTVRTSSRRTIDADIKILLEIYQDSWSQNWGFTPMSIAEAASLAAELKPIVDTDFFALFYYKDEPVASMVAIPDMNPLLRKLDGSIGISAPWHWLRARNEIRSGYRLLLFGIKEQFRMMGLPMLMLDFIFEQAKVHQHLQWVEGSWSLEDNVLINDLIEDFSGTLYKRYRIYRKDW